MDGREIVECDLLVDNACVLTLDGERRVYPAGAIAISGGRIAAVGSSRDVLPFCRAKRAINADGNVVHPGFIETHMHVSYHLSRFAYPDHTQWDDVMAFYADFWNALTADDEYASSLLACLEMARNGTTCYLEAGSVFEPDAAAAATEAVGMRGILADPFLWDYQGEGEGLWRGAAESRTPFSRERALGLLGGQLKRNAAADALVHGHVAIRGSGSCSDELELAAKACADAAGVVVNKHQSYSRRDTAADDRRHGRHALVHYGELGVLGSNCVMSHVNIVRDDEIDFVRESGLSISWCPYAAMLSGPGGTFEGRHGELHAAGVNVALGSDSVNWAGTFDMPTQAVLAFLTARAKADRSDALGAEDVLEMATINGARAVGKSGQLGSLEVGKRADLVVRRSDLPAAHPGLDAVQSVVLGSRSKSVDTVIVGGEVIVEDGRSTMVDEAEAYARADVAARAVLERMGYVPPRSRWPRIA